LLCPPHSLRIRATRFRWGLRRTGSPGRRRLALTLDTMCMRGRGVSV
jgi:hypothetical protein